MLLQENNDNKNNKHNSYHAYAYSNIFIHILLRLCIDSVYFCMLSDHATELRLAKAKITELETACYTQRLEVSH